MRTAEPASRRLPCSLARPSARREKAMPGRDPVEVGMWTDPEAWDAFVLGAPDGTIAHRWAWLRIVSETYGHQVHPAGGGPRG